ncbi:MAG: hypothetical protein JWN76_3423, partial [Chitinophagaceae bacterium]|nr:hypothetical protein [Chitinophagaceae bacterium]
FLIINMRFKTLALVLILFISQQLTAQPDCRLRISILTCSPGDELYMTFGHSAIRVTDSLQGVDNVFNYGTFNFDDPNFYSKFVRGKLDYMLSVSSFNDFMYEYQVEKRSVIEQQLNLSCSEKQQLYAALIHNYQGPERFYKYDFLFDNCTTRERDLLKKYSQNFQVASPIIPPRTSYRNLIHAYLDKGGEPWSKLGIDILLGSPVDKLATNDGAMFLPDFFMKSVDSAKGAGGKLVKEKKMILPGNANASSQNNNLPLILFSLISSLIIIISMRTENWAVKATRITDSFLFYLTGIVGILILFMWTATDHSMCRNNLNIIWALPTHFIAAFYVFKRPAFIRKYFFITAIINAFLLLSWFWLPQQFNVSLVPLVILLMYRSSRLSKS